MAEIEGLSPELATTFFKKKVFSSVKEYLVDSTNLEQDAPESGEPLIADLLIKCITEYKIPIKQVRVNHPHTFISCYTIQIK